MMRVAVVVGSVASQTAAGASALPSSDRGALALALARFGDGVCAYAADADASGYARAAGVAHVELLSSRPTDAVDVDAIGPFDVALIGRGGCGSLGDALPAQLAEAHGAALVYDTVDLQPQADRIVVTRDLGRGARDLLGVRGCAVLAIADSIARGPYVSRYRLDAQRAAQPEARESEEREAQSADDAEAREAQRAHESSAHAAHVAWQPAAPRVRLGDHAARVGGRAVERMNALFGVGKAAEKTASLVRESPEACAQQLLRYLSHHGFVDRGAAAESAGAPAGAAASALTRRPDERGPERSAVGDGPLPIRARRRPRLVGGRARSLRGPFEIGVDT